MKKKSSIIIGLIAILIIIVLLCGFMFLNKTNETEFVSVKSKAELMKIYKGEKEYSYDDNIFAKILAMPFSFFYSMDSGYYYKGGLDYATLDDVSISDSRKSSGVTPNSISSNTYESATTQTNISNNNDFSTTNIQVENVDEADIIKTDGKYIYSLSEDKVIITDASDEKNLKIVSQIQINEDNFIPEDMILYKNRLVIISSNGSSYYSADTLVDIIDISNKEKPVVFEEFKLLSKYYTSRCIDGKLLIISNGTLRKDDDEIITYYEEENERKEIELSDIRYLKDVKSNKQTIIASYDLNKAESVNVKSYLFDVDNAYISENNMYLLEEKYDRENDNIKIADLYGPGGVIGFFHKIIENDRSYSYDRNTHIFKFNIDDNGDIKYDCKTKIKGTTINQFSLDEYKGNLRIGLYTYNGSRVAIFDKKLNLLGESSYLSKGEKMYSTRFIENKAYMVTYRNTDPLYVIDLSNPSKPTVLGKLKIPGYSTYLHPYDENHLIGIGMQSEEKVYRDKNGKVTSTTATITGMKMALFDVSDVNNPKQISETVIGDSRTTSAILTNHKALLFSKEKGIIAIPVNNYAEDVSISTSTTDDIDLMVKSYRNYGKKYIAEGYFVYDINLENGIKYKGTITHNKTASKYLYRNTSRLLRGLWIKDNLFTVSEDMIKVNNLKTLEEISTMKIEDKSSKVVKTDEINASTSNLVNNIVNKATSAADYFSNKAEEEANKIEDIANQLEKKIVSLENNRR